MTSGLAAQLAESIPPRSLFVEDNLVNQTVTPRFLQRMGHRAIAGPTQSSRRPPESMSSR